MLRERPLLSAFELLLSLLFIFIVLVLTTPTKATPPRIATFGQYAVTITWRPGSNADVDLWIADPEKNICWWQNQDAELMYLESDNLGTSLSGVHKLPNGKVVVVRHNGERTVIKGIVPGEYIVNLHLFNRRDDVKPIPVLVELWSLRGDDRVIYSRKVTLIKNGQEATAFRFTLDKGGNAGQYNTLPKSIITAADPNQFVTPTLPTGHF